MEAGALTKKMVELAVDRGIREIGSDPHRGFRKLVDMGGLFAAGRFQKRFFAQMQTLLEREDSPYYDMVRRAAANVDSRHLKTFGMALGWESWTVGAERIRRFEAQRGYNIPWSLSFRLGGGAGAMTASDYRRVLAEARAKGICTYFFFLGGDREGLSMALDLAGGQSECAFLLLVPPDLLDPAAQRAAARRDNAVLLLDAGDPGWPRAARRLREDRRLYGLYRTYRSQAEAGELTAGAWVEGILGDAGPILLCVAGPECPDTAREQVSAWTEEARRGQRWPLLPMDYHADVLLVDQVISDGERFLAAGPDGGVLSYSRTGGERPLPLNFRTQGLTELLEAAERLT